MTIAPATGTPDQPAGSLTLDQRVQVARDVIKMLNSNQRKIKIVPNTYLVLKRRGQEVLQATFSGAVTSRKLGSCAVCARGALFIAAVDRYNQCNVEKSDNLYRLARSMSEYQWGVAQSREIEAAFERTTQFGGSTEAAAFGRRFGLNYDHNLRLLAICQNIVDNGGWFRP